MKRGKKVALIVLGLVVIIAVPAFVFASQGGDESQEAPTVEVGRGTIVDQALAVGTIEPRVEVSVKSQFSGVVKRQFAEVGDYVRAGTPLLEIKPNPTPRELVDAERQIEMRGLEVQNLQREFERQQTLFEKKLVAEQDYARAKRAYEEAALGLRVAREQLALLREGKVDTDSGSYETVVRAPVSGFILDKMIEIGDPVVPLTSYQEGTVLMTMADMEDLLFRGTVDEIDVGRLQEGMTARIRVGALPNAAVNGRVAKIWLKARKEENSTVFPVEIEIVDAMAANVDAELPALPVVLRAGYSANAEIEIERRDSVLLVPERVVTFAGDTARVTIMLPDGTEAERLIETGLSDAIHTEVLSGLEEGAKVKEKPLQEIR